MDILEEEHTLSAKIYALFIIRLIQIPTQHRCTLYLYYMKCSIENIDYSNEKHPPSPITHPHQLGLRCMDRLQSSIHTSSMRDASLRRVASMPVSKLLHHGRAKEVAKQVTIHHHSIAIVPSIFFPIASLPESRTPFPFQI